MTGAAPPLLRVQGLTKRFGGIEAVADVSFNLASGTILGLIGPNGSGKTTLLNTINGVYPPDGGYIWFENRRIDGLPAYRRVDLGMSRTFQTPRVFSTISVLRNMLVPMVHRSITGHDTEDRAVELLASVGLAEYAHLAASELSGGQQKLLEFARALMPSPRLVLMDEPFAGVHPQIKRTLLDNIRGARSRGVSFIIVSHELPAIMGLSQEVMCLDYGRVIGQGTPEEIRHNPAVIDSYLGHARESTS